MTISDSKKLVNIFNDLIERNQLLIAATSRKDVGGVQVMMGGSGPAMMAMLAQAVASFYQKYQDNMKEGVSFDEFLDDFETGVRMAYKDIIGEGDGIITDMGGLIDLSKTKGEEE